jgi:hypothetical protein
MSGKEPLFRWNRGLLLGLLLLVSGAYVIAEDLTLTTYYPSPRGVYDQLQSMGQTLLSQQTGSVGVGTTVAPPSKLGVSGSASIGSNFVNVAAPPDGLAVEGNVGVGIATPLTKLDGEGGVKVGCQTACNAGLAGTVRWADTACSGLPVASLQVCNGSAWERISSSVFTPCTPPGSQQTRTISNCRCAGGMGFIWAAEETCTCDAVGNWTSCTNTCSTNMPPGYTCP